MAGDAFSFTGALQLLKNLGVFDVILPVILVYAVIFGILTRVRIFEKEEGDGKTRKVHHELNATIALIMALLLVGAANITGLIQKFLPFVGLMSVLIVSFLMLASLIVGDFSTITGKDNTLVRSLLLIFTAVGFIFTFGLAAGWWTIGSATGLLLNGQGLFTLENISVLIFIAILGALIFWITKSTTTKK